MKVNKSLWLLLSISALVGCDKSIEENEQTVTQTPLVKSYQPREFVADQRIEKIQTLTHDLQTIFENHAKERHIPGIAYGIVVDDSLVIASHTGITSLSTQTPVSARSSFRIASTSSLVKPKILSADLFHSAALKFIPA